MKSAFYRVFAELFFFQLTSRSR